jgi:hypothetical protein
MVMLTVDYEADLRAAFEAGRASMTPALLGARGLSAERFGVSPPATYEEWIASRKHPPIARG